MTNSNGPDTVEPTRNGRRPAAAPRRNNRRGQGEKLREDLLEAADALIDEAGDAHSLSLRSVAARCGVAATSVYLHFADLDALKAALARRHFIAFLEARSAATADFDPVADPVRALIARNIAYVRYALDHPGAYRLMVGRDLPELPGGPDEPNRRALAALADSIAACQARGLAPDDSDPANLAVLVWSALHGQATLRMDRTNFPWPPLEETIADLVGRLVGLRRPAPGDPAPVDSGG